MTTKHRETNYDLLKIICCLGVLMIHSNMYFGPVSSNPLYEEVSTSFVNKNDLIHIMFSYFFHDCFHFAVPCFMMISGAFLLNNDKNADYKTIFRKMLVGIIIPTLIFTLLYIFFTAGIQLYGFLFKGRGLDYLWVYLLDVLRGKPNTYLWYMYTLSVIYPFVPLIIKLKNNIGEEKFKKVSIVYFVFSMVSGWTTDFSILHWSIAKAVCYIGYFLLGYQIKRNIKKDNKKGILYIALGLLIMCLMAVLRHWHTSLGGRYGNYRQDEPFALLNLFGPFIVPASILIFSGFSKLDLKENMNISKFASDTFYIYMFQGFAINIESRIYYQLYLYNYDSIPFTIILFLFTLFLSFILTKIYKKVWAYIDNKFQINNSVLKLFKLN